jgi:hypothetical protein
MLGCGQVWSRERLGMEARSPCPPSSGKREFGNLSYIPWEKTRDIISYPRLGEEGLTGGCGSVKIGRLSGAEIIYNDVKGAQ